MIVGIGIDLVRIDRLRSVVDRHGERARQRLFTARELAECDRRGDPDECLAARFAAKEAALKALGTGKTVEIRWTDVETVRDEAGRPRLELHGAARSRADVLGAALTWVSLTHEAGTACAVVVLESDS